MFVCLCNALRERDVDQVIARGVTETEDVYRALGVEPQCGACACEIEDRIVSGNAVKAA